MAAAAGSALHGTLISSYRTAARAAAADVGTDVVLVECLNRLASTWPVVGAATRDLRHGRGGQPPGEEWRRRDLDPGAGAAGNADLEAAAALREAAWLVAGQAPERPWTGAVRAAVRQAVLDAGTAGAGYAGVVDLLAVLLRQRTGTRAHDLLDRYGLDGAELARQLRPSSHGRPWVPTYQMLRPVGLVAGQSRPVRALTVVVRGYLTRSIHSGLVRYVLDHEANRQCIRLGHPRVTPVHQLLAVSGLDAQLSAVHATLRQDLAPPDERVRSLLRRLDIALPDLRDAVHATLRGQVG